MDTGHACLQPIVPEMKVLRPKIDIFGLQCVLNVEYNWPLNQKQAVFKEKWVFLSRS